MAPRASASYRTAVAATAALLALAGTANATATAEDLPVDASNNRRLLLATPSITPSDARLVLSEFSTLPRSRSYVMGGECVKLLAGDAGSNNNKANAACSACHSQWHATMMTYETRLRNYERALAEYRAAMAKYQRDEASYQQAVQQRNLATAANSRTTPGSFGTQYDHLPSAPVPAATDSWFSFSGTCRRCPRGRSARSTARGPSRSRRARAGS